MGVADEKILPCWWEELSPIRSTDEVEAGGGGRWSPANGKSAAVVKCQVSFRLNRS